MPTHTNSRKTSISIAESLSIVKLPIPSGCKNSKACSDHLRCRHSSPLSQAVSVLDDSLRGMFVNATESASWKPATITVPRPLLRSRGDSRSPDSWIITQCYAIVKWDSGENPDRDKESGAPRSTAHPGTGANACSHRLHARSDKVLAVSYWPVSAIDHWATFQYRPAKGLGAVPITSRSTARTCSGASRKSAGRSCARSSESWQ
jgi:hypothetical protein